MLQGIKSKPRIVNSSQTGPLNFDHLPEAAQSKYPLIMMKCQGLCFVEVSAMDFEKIDRPVTSEIINRYLSKGKLMVSIAFAGLGYNYRLWDEAVVCGPEVGTQYE